MATSPIPFDPLGPFRNPAPIQVGPDQYATQAATSLAQVKVAQAASVSRQSLLFQFVNSLPQQSTDPVIAELREKVSMAAVEELTFQGELTVYGYRVSAWAENAPVYAVLGKPVPPFPMAPTAPSSVF